MRLTDHFTLDELTHSQTAARLGLANDPPPDVVQTLIGTAHGLEMVRALLQAPLLISSGYRSPLVNRAVGGSPNSQHITGHAVGLHRARLRPPRGCGARHRGAPRDPV
jgi:zinc D-Ala-D-Ala carboxypeptidase